MATERTQNMVPCLVAKSNAGDNADVILWADPSTHRLLVDVSLSGGGTSMADDAAFTPGTTEGTPIFGFYDDVATDSVNEGDAGAIRMSGNRVLYTQLRDAAGNERGVNVNASNELLVALSSVPSHAVTNAGTFAVQESGSALTALQLIDDVIFTDDTAFTPGTSKVAMVGFQYDDTGTDSVDEGDAGAARMSARREIYTQIRDAAGNERGVNVNASGQMAVAGPVTNAGTFVVQENGAALTALQLIDDVIFTDDTAFTPGTSKVAMIGAEFDNSGTDSVDEGDAGALRMSANRNLFVAIRDSAGNERGLNIDANGALAAVAAGDIAHDAADSGNPVKIGGKALTSQPTAVTANDRVNAMFDVYGRQITMASLREMKGNQITTITASTSETTVVTADATYKLDVYAVFVTNTSATATEVSFKDSTGGTTRFTLSVPAGDMRGFTLTPDAGHVQSAANNNWTATCADSVSSIIITVLFVKNL